MAAPKRDPSDDPEAAEDDADVEGAGHDDVGEGDEDDEEEELVIDDALLSQDAGIFVQAWPSALHRPALADLRADATVLFAAADGQSFWPRPPSEHGAAATATLCTLERFALDVYRFHVGRLGAEVQLDPASSGAEFWVQARDAAAAGLNAELEGAQGVERVEGDERRNEAEAAEAGAAPQSINWHMDKDEELLDQTDMYLHPLISTVTYLGIAGAPTVVGDVRLDVRKTPILSISTLFNDVHLTPRRTRVIQYDGTVTGTELAAEEAEALPPPTEIGPVKFAVRWLFSRSAMPRC